MGESDRIRTLDVLRGLALCGMIVVHFHQAFRTSTEGLREWPGEWLIGWIVWWGLEEKSAAIFAFLFGVGFAILLRRAEAAGRPIVFPYLRRLAMLAFVGVVVEATTDYAILVTLAVWGIPLLIVRNLPTRWLLALAFVSALAAPAYNLTRAIRDVRQASPPVAEQTARPARVQPRTWAEHVERQLTRMRARYLSWRAVIPGVTFTLFLLGLIALRRGVFDRPREHVRLIVGAMAFGLACWLLFWLVLPRMPESWHDWSEHAWPIRYGLGIIEQQWLAFTYMGAVVLLLAFREAWQRRLDAFAIVGRMAFTNYVLQAVAIYLLASRFTLHLRLRPYYYVAGAVILCALLVAFSRWWLARFRYGPLEWSWRSVTYLTVPRLRRA